MSKECSANPHACTCPWVTCENHGKCCQCIARHRKDAMHPPMCYPQAPFGYDNLGNPIKKEEE